MSDLLSALGRVLRSTVRRSAEGPSTGRPATFSGPVIVLAVFAALPVFSSSSFQLARYELVLTYMMVVIGLNLGFGFAGQLMVAQPVLMGGAAYTAGLLNLDDHWNAWETLVPAIAVAVLLGVLLYLPGFRLRGWYLAITTFFAVLVFPTVIIAAGHWTGGTNGESPISSFPGFVGSNPTAQFEFVLLLTAICWLGVRQIMHSRLGIMMKAMRDSPPAAQAAGVNITVLGLIVAGLASLPVGLAGWTYAHTTELIAPISFGFNLLLLLVAAVMLGGRGTFWGPVLGTIIFELFSLYVEPFGTINSLILGAGVFLSATFFPFGVIPPVLEWFRAWFARTGSRGDRRLDTLGVAVPEHLAATASAAALSGAGAQVDTGEPVLRATGITKLFGGNLALDDVDLDLYPGLVHGLVGPNGSGKTTLLNVVSGFVQQDRGQIWLRDTPIEGARPHEIARLGIRRSFQVPQLVLELSVAQNIRIGLAAVKLPRGRSGWFRRRRNAAEIATRVTAAAAALGLSSRHMDVPVKELSLGLRRIVEIARAMVAEPTVICLDEPAAGLAEEDIGVVERALRQIAASGCAVLLIEHNLAFVHRVADIVVELADGHVERVKDMRTEHAAGARAPVAATARPDAVPVRAAATEAPCLLVEGLDAWYGQAQALRGVSISVQPGEIVGVLGRNGVGKSTLLKSISRMHRRARGRICLFGEDILGLTPEVVASKGIGLVREGAIVFDTFTVRDHLDLAVTLAQRRKATADIAEVADWFPVLWDRLDERGGYLSGGQRQMLCLAMALLAQPTCLLLDEPSAGLAESVVATVYESVRRISAEKQLALLIAEQDGRWLEGLASRAYVLDNGMNVAERDGADLGEPDDDVAWLART